MAELPPLGSYPTDTNKHWDTVPEDPSSQVDSTGPRGFPNSSPSIDSDKHYSRKACICTCVLEERFLCVQKDIYEYYTTVLGWIVAI